MGLLRHCCSAVLLGPSTEVFHLSFSELLHPSKEALEFILYITDTSQKHRLVFTDKNDCFYQRKLKIAQFFRLFQIIPKTTAQPSPLSVGQRASWSSLLCVWTNYYIE